MHHKTTEVLVFIYVFFPRRFTKRVYVSLPNEEVSIGFYVFSSILDQLCLKEKQNNPPKSILYIILN